jgi:hypothetical protein
MENRGVENMKLGKLLSAVSKGRIKSLSLGFGKLAKIPHSWSVSLI